MKTTTILIEVREFDDVRGFCFADAPGDVELLLCRGDGQIRRYKVPRNQADIQMAREELLLQTSVVDRA